MSTMSDTDSKSAIGSMSTSTNISSDELKQKFNDLWASTSGRVSNWYADRDEELPAEKISNFMSECGHRTYELCTHCSTRTANSSREASRRTYNCVSDMSVEVTHCSNHAVKGCSDSCRMDNVRVCASNASKNARQASARAATNCSSGGTACRVHTHACADDTTYHMKNIVAELSEPPEDSKNCCGNMCNDYKRPLQSQRLKTRLLCFPCQCGMVCSSACYNCDFDSLMTVLLCCPCRTLLAMFPTSYEKGKAIPKQDLGDHYSPMDDFDEPEELPYKQPNLSTVESDAVELNAYQELNTEDDDLVFKDEDLTYDKDITYDQVFELERKKRQLMMNAQKEAQQKEKTEEKTAEQAGKQEDEKAVAKETENVEEKEEEPVVSSGCCA